MDKETKLIVVDSTMLIIVVIVFIIFFAIKKKIGGNIEANRAVNDLQADEAANNKIAEQSGLSSDAVRRCREIALNVAKALQTQKNAGFFTFGEDEDLAIDNLNRAESREEMILINRFYTDDATDGRSLLADLKKFLYNWQLDEIDLFTEIK